MYPTPSTHFNNVRCTDTYFLGKKKRTLEISGGTWITHYHCLTYPPRKEPYKNVNLRSILTPVCARVVIEMRTTVSVRQTLHTRIRGRYFKDTVCLPETLLNRHDRFCTGGPLHTVNPRVQEPRTIITGLQSGDSDLLYISLQLLAVVKTY
jgi:hypothetical protein